MSIKVNLISQDTEVSINKDEWKLFYPESMITHTFELDTEATLIPISKSFVTPEMINYLNLLINTKEITLPLPEGNLSKVGDYLGIPILQVIGSPLYLQCHEHLRSLLKFPWTFITYDAMRILATQKNYPELLQYLFDHTKFCDEDLYGMDIAVNFGETKVIPLYLKRLPDTISLNRYIYDASVQGYIDVLKILMSSKRVTWNKENTQKCFD